MLTREKLEFQPSRLGTGWKAVISYPEQTITMQLKILGIPLRKRTIPFSEIVRVSNVNLNEPSGVWKYLDIVNRSSRGMPPFLAPATVPRRDVRLNMAAQLSGLFNCEFAYR